MALETGSEEMLLLLETFEKYQVQYLIVGGFAVNRYGYKRTTGDLDIYLKDTPENRTKLIEALDAMGYGRFDMLMDVPIIAGYCEIMMDDGIYADLMTDIPGLDKDRFDHYYEMATVDKLDNYVIRFLHYNHLLKNKEATGRAKDLLDISELERINNSNPDTTDSLIFSIQKKRPDISRDVLLYITIQKLNFRKQDTHHDCPKNKQFHFVAALPFVDGSMLQHRQ
jgi:hypothetical protein